MLQTITMGSNVSVQGLLVRQLPDGKMVVSVDNKHFVGTPVTSRTRTDEATA